MKKYGVIMAGGGGTRFWPLSRLRRPKQLLNLTGHEVMVNEAIDRLSFTVDFQNIFIVTNANQADEMEKVTASRIRADHILREPSGRNTAACIGYAAMEILKKYGDGVMIITPSDAYIRDTAAFTRTLSEAVKAAEEQDRLVTIGIKPLFPATGYGYIRFDKEQAEEAKQVEEFREKPDLETAKSYLASGAYAWNSGMFIWKAGLILEMFKKWIPDIYEDLCRIGDVMGTKQEKEVIQEVYPKIRKISIDYAIMEPAAAKGSVLVVPGDFGWNDLGSWDMMHVLHDADGDGNICVGDVITIDSRDNIIYSSGRMISVLGVDNLVVVETSDAVMVCDKSKVQKVKEIVDVLEDRGRNELL